MELIRTPQPDCDLIERTLTRNGFRWSVMKLMSNVCW